MRIMKKITELERLLSHSVELYLNEDGDRIVIKSGDDRPPEMDEFFKEFMTRAQAKRWLHQTVKRLKEQKDGK